MDVEVEVVDETALRAFQVANHHDADGNDIGPHVPSADEALGMVLGRVLVEAMQGAGGRIGVKLVSSSTMTRHLGESGMYAQVTLPAIPVRGDDGEFEREWPAPPTG